MKTTVILGAGCSKGMANLPTDVSFMNDRNDEIFKSTFLLEALLELYHRRENGVLTSSAALWRKERLEVCWNEIEENRLRPKIILKSNEIDNWFRKLNELAKREKGSEYEYYSYFLYEDSASRSPYQYLFIFAEWELRKIVAKRFETILDVSLKERYDRLRTKITSTANNDCLNFISFNYDTLIEQSYSPDDWYYAGPNPNPGLVHKNKIGIIKPHGSVNWLDIDGEDIIIHDRPIASDKIGYKNGKLHRHAIVGLVGEKKEYQTTAIDYPRNNLVYADQISNAINTAIESTQQLIIIGYSFPITDGHIRGTFRHCNSQNLEKVIIIDQPRESEQKEALIDKTNSIFGIPKDKIDFVSEGIENWIK